MKWIIDRIWSRSEAEERVLLEALHCTCKWGSSKDMPYGTTSITTLNPSPAPTQMQMDAENPVGEREQFTAYTYLLVLG